MARKIKVAWRDFCCVWLDGNEVFDEDRGGQEHWLTCSKLLAVKHSSAVSKSFAFNETICVKNACHLHKFSTSLVNEADVLLSCTS